MGPNSPFFILARLNEKRGLYPYTIGFHLSDWEDAYRHLVKAMVHVSRYTSNTIDQQQDWDLDLLKIVADEVNEIIKAENKSASPKF